MKIEKEFIIQKLNDGTFHINNKTDNRKMDASNVKEMLITLHHEKLKEVMSFIETYKGYVIVKVNPNISSPEHIKVGAIFGSNEKYDCDHYVYDSKSRDFISAYETKLFLIRKKDESKKKLCERISVFAEANKG